MVRSADSLTPNLLTRVRRAASVIAFGAPIENITHLQKLKEKLAAAGHCLEYETCPVKDMRQVVISCARKEHNKYRKVAEAKRKDGGTLTAEVELAGLSCQGAEKRWWVEKNKKILNTPSNR